MRIAAERLAALHDMQCLIDGIERCLRIALPEQNKNVLRLRDARALRLTAKRLQRAHGRLPFLLPCRRQHRTDSRCGLLVRMLQQRLQRMLPDNLQRHQIVYRGLGQKNILLYN